jgi:hypothetical protein
MIQEGFLEAKSYPWTCFVWQNVLKQNLNLSDFKEGEHCPASHKPWSLFTLGLNCIFILALYSLETFCKNFVTLNLEQ